MRRGGERGAGGDGFEAAAVGGDGFKAAAGGIVGPDACAIMVSDKSPWGCGRCVRCAQLKPAAGPASCV